MSNLDLSTAGFVRLLEREEAGEYPGGAARQRERRQIITTYTRPHTLTLLAKKKRPAAWALYKRTFAWNRQLGRWKFLLGFPIYVLKAALLGR